MHNWNQRGLNTVVFFLGPTKPLPSYGLDRQVDTGGKVLVNSREMTGRTQTLPWWRWGEGIKTTEKDNDPILPCSDTVESEGRQLKGVATKCSRTQRKHHRTSTVLNVANQSATVRNVAFTKCKQYVKYSYTETVTNRKIFKRLILQNLSKLYDIDIFYDCVKRLLCNETVYIL
jgi:hypothetical protein